MSALCELFFQFILLLCLSDSMKFGKELCTVQFKWMGRQEERKQPQHLSYHSELIGYPYFWAWQYCQCSWKFPSLFAFCSKMCVLVFMLNLIRHSETFNNICQDEPTMLMLSEWQDKSSKNCIWMSDIWITFSFQHFS